MKRLIYHSTARTDLGPDEVFKIVSQSSLGNGRVGLTGFLAFRSGRFLQLLEGDAEALDGLYARVRQDPRHHDVETLFEGDAEQRCFPSWRMKRIGPQEVASAVETLTAHRDASLPPEARDAIAFFMGDQPAERLPAE